MPEREKVIMALEKGIATAEAIEAIAGGFVYLTKEEVRDALELLEEQQKTIDLLYNLLNERCKEFRAKTEGDEVCGLCQYDGAYVGQSGDWCNECPGFETNECFEMKNEIRRMCGKELLPEQ